MHALIEDGKIVWIECEKSKKKIIHTAGIEGNEIDSHEEIEIYGNFFHIFKDVTSFFPWSFLPRFFKA